MKAVVFDGIVLGLQFGLLGVGLTLVYGLGGVLNLAHGPIAVFGAIVVSLRMDAGAPATLAAITGLAAAGAIGLVLDQIYYYELINDVGRCTAGGANRGCCSGCC